MDISTIKDTKMKKLLFIVMATLYLAFPVTASEVYIEQAGSGTNIDILQQNGSNRINSDLDPMIINGDDINIEIVQDGDGNVAEIYITLSANDTNFEYRVEGDMNELLSNISGGTDNSFIMAIIGNDNVITLCKEYQNGTCIGIEINLTNNIINVIGNNNEINFALDSDEALNTFNIGQNIPSDFNIINLTQKNVTGHIVNVTIDGSNNTVDIVQE